MMNTDLEALLRDAGRTPPASGVDVTGAMDRARTVRKRRRLVVAGGAAALLVAGMTFALNGPPLVDRSPAPAGTAATGGDPVQTQLESTLMQAYVHGVVRRSGDCLLLDQGGSPTVVVWPPGTRWSADDQVVVLADGLRVGLGDEVGGGGGYVSASRRSLTLTLGAESADRAIRCAQLSGKRSVALIAGVEKI